MAKTLNEKFVLIAGSGELPQLVLREADAAGAAVCVLTLPGTETSGFDHYHQIPVTLDSYLDVLGDLAIEGYRQIVLAGGVRRPNARTGAVVDVWDGDDAAIRRLVAPLEATGFEIVGVQELIPNLLSVPGILTRAQPNDMDRADAARAARIAEALGRVDVGQAVVVARRLCIAVETIAGTNAMLKAAGSVLESQFAGERARKGLLFKAPKPGQELRVDCPVIGPDTIRHVADAGLRGIAVESGGVILLQRQAMIEAADQTGLFIWSVPKEPD